jgi:hypothetical protein
VTTPMAEMKAPEAPKAVAKVPEKDKTSGTARPAARRGPPEPGTPAGRKTATAILEVLGGERSPTEAAEALGVSLPRYYAIEARALAGFLVGCEPPPVGRRVSPEREVERLRRENERLLRDLARQQALARTAARAAGLSSQPAAPKAGKDGKRRKRRRPMARALRVAATLVQKAPEGSPVLPLSSSPSVPPLSVAVVK